MLMLNFTGEAAPDLVEGVPLLEVVAVVVVIGLVCVVPKAEAEPGGVYEIELELNISVFQLESYK